MTTLLFVHGWRSVPGGVKPTYLREQGFHVLNPPFDDDDFAAVVAKAQRILEMKRPPLIVRGSRGGAMA
jgi:hypothetical protein